MIRHGDTIIIPRRRTQAPVRCGRCGTDVTTAAQRDRHDPDDCDIMLRDRLTDHTEG